MQSPYRVWPRSIGLQVAAFVWCLPVLILGGAVAVAFTMLGWARPILCDGAVDLVTSGPFARWMTARRWAAFTFGPFVWYWDEASGASDRVRRHEREHVRQFLLWGPVMLIAYPVASAWAAIRGGDFYRDNAFERAARRIGEG